MTRIAAITVALVVLAGCGSSTSHPASSANTASAGVRLAATLMHAPTLVRTPKTIYKGTINVTGALTMSGSFVSMPSGYTCAELGKGGVSMWDLATVQGSQLGSHALSIHINKWRDLPKAPSGTPLTIKQADADIFIDHIQYNAGHGLGTTLLTINPDGSGTYEFTKVPAFTFDQDDSKLPPLSGKITWTCAD